MPDDPARDVVKLWEALEGERGTWLSSWQQNANYMLTSRNDYLTARTPGARRQQYVFDSTPIWACEQFAAGLHGMQTSPTLQWFALEADDDRVNAMADVRAWLEQASKVMYGLFNSSRHNFASQTHELYLDQGNIGSACMAVLDSPTNGILFSTRHMKEVAWSEGAEDRVDTVVRQWEFTADQAVKAWGARAGETANKLAATAPTRKLRYLHATRPRPNRDPQRADRRNKPWSSIYVALDDMTTIDEGGYDEFPYLCPRFSKVSGETYGRGPGWTALPDAKMLNEMVKTVLKSAQKIVDPPLFLPDDGFIVPIKTAPGSLNYFRSGMRQTDRLFALDTKGDIRIGLEMINAVRQMIIRTFYVEWMLMPSDLHDPAAAGKGVTATYTLQQRDEKMRLMSPMLARGQAEFLAPLIDRVFPMLWRKSVARRFGPGSPFPPPPAALSGVPLQVRYVSPLALAQRTNELDAVGRLIQMQMQLRQIDPQAPLLLDSESIMRLTGRDLNAPSAVLRSPEILAQEAQARAAAEQAMAAAQHDQMAASTLKDAGQGVRHIADAMGGGASGQMMQAAA